VFLSFADAMKAFNITFLLKCQPKNTTCVFFEKQPVSMEMKYESLLRYACRRKTEMKLRTKNVTCAGGFGRTGKKNLPGKSALV